LPFETEELIQKKRARNGKVPMNFQDDEGRWENSTYFHLLFPDFLALFGFLVGFICSFGNGRVFLKDYLNFLET